MRHAERENYLNKAKDGIGVEHRPIGIKSRPRKSLQQVVEHPAAGHDSCSRARVAQNAMPGKEVAMIRGFYQMS